jgi:hypothetical protein
MYLIAGSLPISASKRLFLDIVELLFDRGKEKQLKGLMYF